jgi:hypothetical protein
MEPKRFIPITVIILIALACDFVTNPLTNPTDVPLSPSSADLTDESQPVDPNSSLITPTVSSDGKAICHSEIVITGLNEVDLGDGSKLVHVTLGLENKGTMWAKLRGPDDDEDTETQKSVFITTQDGSVYGFLGRGEGMPSQLLSDSNRTIYEERGAVVTALIPPEFAIVGQTVNGKPHYYGFAFLIPSAQIPTSLTMKNMSLWCLGPPVVDQSAQETVDLVETYSLTSNITEVRALPVADKFPNLVGSELDMDYPGESIEFTGVSRNGNIVNITFNYINDSSNEAYPSLSGYIIGNSRLASCPTAAELDCEHDSVSMATIQPGQTAQGLIASFIVPESETDLFFAYVEGDVSELNRIYRIDAADISQSEVVPEGTESTNSNNQETSFLCKNDYFPVSEGARWLYLVIDTRTFTGLADYSQVEIHNVKPSGFDLFLKDTGGSAASLKDDPSATSMQWFCLLDGLASSTSGPGGMFLPDEIPADTTWKEAIGTDAEITYTSLGIENIDVSGGGSYYAVKVKAVSRSEPDVIVYRWFAEGVGIVRTQIEAPGFGRVEQLVSYSPSTP